VARVSGKSRMVDDPMELAIESEEGEQWCKYTLPRARARLYSTKLGSTDKGI